MVARPQPPPPPPPLSGVRHQLECRRVSLVSSLSNSSSSGAAGCWSRIWRPSVAAKILSEISLQARDGELHAVYGLSGSGKSALLETVAQRTCANDGSGSNSSSTASCSGLVLLDGHMLTGDRFRQHGAYHSFADEETTHDPSLFPAGSSLNDLIFYKFRLAGCTQRLARDETTRLLDEFELSTVRGFTLRDLSRCERRRARLALVLAASESLRLIVLDEPISRLDPVDAFQLLSCLVSHASRHSRVVLLSLDSAPRSDLLPLLARITLLFYGRTMFSGAVSEMTRWFATQGWRCPLRENPTVYFLSLATPDLETPARQSETHLQADALVDAFLQHPIAVARVESPKMTTTDGDGGVTGRQAWTRQLGILISREFHFLRCASSELSARLIVWPTAFVACALLGPRLLSSKFSSPSTPASVSIFIGHLVVLAGLLPLLVTARSFESRRFGDWLSSCGQKPSFWPPLSALAHLIATLPLHLGALFASICLLSWLSEAPSIQSSLGIFLSLLPLSILVAPLRSIVILGLAPRGSIPALLVGLELAVVVALGELRNLHHSLDASLHWALVVGVLPELSVAQSLRSLLISGLRAGVCSSTAGGSQNAQLLRDGVICRWRSGDDYLVGSAATASPSPDNASFSLLLLLLHVGVSLVVCLLNALLLVLVVSIVYALRRSGTRHNGIKR